VFATLNDILYIKFMKHNYSFQHHLKYSRTYSPKKRIFCLTHPIFMTMHLAFSYTTKKCFCHWGKNSNYVVLVIKIPLNITKNYIK
jgi:hypothetical protein